MTVNELYSLLSQDSGSYRFSFLIELSAPDDSVVLRYVNQSEPMEYDGKIYKSEVFTLDLNTSVLGFFGGGSLEIARNFDVVSLIENNTTFKFRAKACVINGDISEMDSVESKYCTVTYEGASLKIKLQKDDRLGMTFPATVFNTANNAGNA